MPESSATSPESRPPLETVVITGLSGSGKGTVLRVFEDLGYYAVDNLPVELIPTFVELCAGREEIRKAALVVDVRERSGLQRFPAMLQNLKASGNAMLVFLTASDEVLQRRFSETRRPHPLGQEGSVLDQVRAERDRLATIEGLADLSIDTSKYSIHDLRRLVVERFGETAEKKPVLLVRVESFGFKHGAPTDCDLLFDVRFLPNPHYEPNCRDLSGLDRPVIEYVSSFPQTPEFLSRVSELLLYLMPHYAAEGKSYLTIGVGCTGGRHRSVMIAEDLASRVAAAGYAAKVVHRDIHKGH